MLHLLRRAGADRGFGLTRHQATDRAAGLGQQQGLTTNRSAVGLSLEHGRGLVVVRGAMGLHPLTHPPQVKIRTPVHQSMLESLPRLLR